MPRRNGFDYAQLDTGFPADPKFVQLAVMAGSGALYREAVGLWTLCLAHAWRNDTADVSELLDRCDSPAAELLDAAGLTAHGSLVGFGKWVESMRSAREADTQRKRLVRSRPAESGGHDGSPVDTTDVQPSMLESHGVHSVVVVVEEDVRDTTTSHEVVAAAAAPWTARDWLEYLVADGLSSRERMTHWTEFWKNQFGIDFPINEFGRFAKLIKDHPGGVSGMMSDITMAALSGLAGNPLDYIDRTATHRRTRRGANFKPVADLTGPADFDRSKYVIRD